MGSSLSRKSAHCPSRFGDNGRGLQPEAPDVSKEAPEEEDMSNSKALRVARRRRTSENRTITSNASAHSPYMPPEVWRIILGLLDLCDIKALRLSSKTWTNLGATFLFQPFVFRPDRDDFEQFKIITRNPFLLGTIDSLRFEIGSLDIYNIARNLCHNFFHLDFSEIPLCGDIALPNCPKACDRCRIQAGLQEYSVWKCRCTSKAQCYQNEDAFRRVFKKLNNLRRINITLQSSTFQSRALLTSWAQGDDNTQFKKINREFSTILSALQAVSLREPLRDLRHDQLPVTFFAIKPEVLEMHTRPFLELEILHLKLHATEHPPRIFWQRLGSTLQSATKPRDLRLGFDQFYSTQTFQGVWYADADLGSWYVPLWQFIEGLVWSELKSLRLEGLNICETGLINVLIRHRSTLRHLELCNTCLEHGSF